MRGFILLVLVVFGAAAGGYVFAKHDDGEPVEPMRLLGDAVAFVQDVAGDGASSDEALGEEGEADGEEAVSDEAASDEADEGAAAEGASSEEASSDEAASAGDSDATEAADAADAAAGGAASVDSFEGLAAWYGPGLEGEQTASGEVFDPSQMTAAHRTLPFGTEVRVTRLDTGDSVVVRINDRGPHTEGRVIDVSQAAAEQIGLVEDGETQVRVEVLGEA